LAQATEYSGVSDTTLMKLIREKILAAGQVAPYAPLEIKRTDLDTEPVLGILQRLKATGTLILEGDALADQRSLFDDNQSLAQRGYYACLSRFSALPNRWIRVTAPVWTVLREKPAFLISCVAMQQ